MQRIPVRTSANARRLPLVDGLDQYLEVFEGGLGEHAVAEVEDVSRTSGGTAQDATDAVADELGRAQQHRGVEVALDSALEADALPAAIQRPPPPQPGATRQSRETMSGPADAISSSKAAVWVPKCTRGTPSGAS